MRRCECAYVLPVILAVLSCLGILTGLLVLQVFDYAQLKNLKLHASESRIDLQLNIFKEFLNSSPASNTQTKTSSYGLVSLAGNLWGSFLQTPPDLLAEPALDATSLHNKFLFPRIDFPEITRAAGACADTDPANYENTKSNFSLSIGSIRSPESCQIQSGSLLQDILLNENIDMFGAFSAPPAVNPLKVSSPGYIDIAGTLYLGRDTIITAGGDLHIHRVINISFPPARLTLVSSTGLVVIDEIEANIPSKYIGWLGVQTPSIQFQDNRLLPPLKSASIWGFYYSSP